jgi:hypothetical protein
MMSESQVEEDEFSNKLVDLVLNNLEFLECVHSSKIDFDQSLIRRAVYRYEKYWMPFCVQLIKAEKCQADEIYPPHDIAWVWRCHMLSPINYRNDCVSVCGLVLDHSCFTMVEIKSKQKLAEKLWHEQKLKPSFEFWDRDDAIGDYLQYKNHVSKLKYDLITASNVEKQFCSLVSLPHFKTRAYMLHLLEKYQKELFYHRQEEAVFAAQAMGCPEMELIRQTHQLHPSMYLKDVLEAKSSLNLNNNNNYSSLPYLKPNRSSFLKFKTFKLVEAKLIFSNSSSNNNSNANFSSQTSLNGEDLDFNIKIRSLNKEEDQEKSGKSRSSQILYDFSLNLPNEQQKSFQNHHRLSSDCIPVSTIEISVNLKENVDLKQRLLNRVKSTIRKRLSKDNLLVKSENVNNSNSSTKKQNKFCVNFVNSMLGIQEHVFELKDLGKKAPLANEILFLKIKCEIDTIIHESKPSTHFAHSCTTISSSCSDFDEELEAENDSGLSNNTLTTNGIKSPPLDAESKVVKEKQSSRLMFSIRPFSSHSYHHRDRNKISSNQSVYSCYSSDYD